MNLSDTAVTNENKWYDEFTNVRAPSKHSLSEIEVLKLKEEAKKHLDGETAAFQLKQSKLRDSETEWLRTALSKGTSNDKVAAAIILIQNNPKYNLNRLINLVSQVKGSKHNQSNLLISSLRDLFLSDLLHPNYKLRKFEEQDLDKITSSNESDIVYKDASRKKILSHWYFEDQLRDQYEKFVLALSAVASDTVETNRERAVSVMTDLLISNSEQEHKLLELLVNKIGDPLSKVASKAVYCLNKLLKTHPNMKIVVLKEIEKLLFRSNISQRAQYYGICLLTQFILDQNDADTANHLIEVYFAFFKACLKKGEPDSRMMAAILTGVNRSYRFVSTETTKLNDHIDSVYKVVHIGSFNVSLSALSLLHQVTSKNPEQERRFYTAFYKKLLDPQIGVAKKRAVFLNLLYRVMKSDKNTSRLYAFIKRVLQVAASFPPCMICATLYTISQIIKIKKELKPICLRGSVEIKKEKESDEEKNEDQNEKKSVDESIEILNISDDVKVLKNKLSTITLPNVVINSSTNADSDIKEPIKIDDDVKTYDPFCINPSKCGAINMPLIELTALAEHYHPSVALFAKTILQGQVIEYSGDPLEDLTLMRFLDRFVFKNPKKLEQKKMNKSDDPFTVRAKYVPRGIRSIPVDSQAYLNESEDRIPVDELYLYRYLHRKREKKAIVKKDEDDSDHESVNSEEFNDLMDRFGGNKNIEDLDFASEFEVLKNVKGKRQKGEESDEESDKDLEENSDGEFDIDDDEFSDDENDDLEDMSDLENDDLEDMSDLDNDDLEDMSDLDNDLEDMSDLDNDDLEDIEFDDEDEDEINLKKSIKSVLNNKTAKKSKKNKIDNNVFVSAEKFAEMLEKQGQSKFKLGGSNVLSDADGASVKQLDWEVKRNEKLRGKYRGKNFKHAKKGSKMKKTIKLKKK